MGWLCYVVTLFNVHNCIAQIQNDVDAFMYYFLDPNM
jgi:hypothetical protein